MGTIKHNFVSALPDDPDTTLVRPSDWNADHDILLTGPDVGLPVGGDITGFSDNIAIGLDSVSTGAYSIAMGEAASATSAYSIAIGYSASAAASGAFALGAYSSAAHANSVALGDLSVTGRTYEISVGDVGRERYVSNVLDGTEDTDAATLSQLNAVNLKLNPGKYVTEFTDFVNLNADKYWVLTSGNGASSGSQNAVGNEVGLFQFTTGATSATARCFYWAGNAAAVQLGNGTAEFWAIFRAGDLSTATDTYTTYTGFVDAGDVAPTDGVFFRYTHGTNGGRYECVARSNNVETGSALDSGVSPSTSTNKSFYIFVNATATSASYYIDGALVATNTANIPSGTGRQTSYGHGFLKSVGTNNVGPLRTDLLGFRVILTNARTITNF